MYSDMPCTLKKDWEETGKVACILFMLNSPLSSISHGLTLFQRMLLAIAVGD